MRLITICLAIPFALSIPGFCRASDGAQALRDGGLNERILAVNELMKTDGSRESMLMALGDPDWQVRLNAASWVGRSGAAERALLTSLLGTETCPLVRMSALYWLARFGREPATFEAPSSSESMRGCESWVGPISRDSPRVPGQKTDLVVATPPDSLGCFYARYKRPGSASCPGGAIVTGTGASPQTRDFLADEAAASGVALCCPPGRDLASGKGIVPERRKTDCHLMPEQCPTGWVEMEPGRQHPAEESEPSWVQCCPQAGTFQPLPPQRPAPIPTCPIDKRIEWLAIGIEGENGCSPSSPNCALKVKEDPAPAPEPLWEPTTPIPPLKQKPSHPPARKPKSPPAQTLIVDRGHDSGELDATIAPLLAGLKSREPRKREDAAVALAGLGPRASSSASGLEAVLKSDPSPRVRAYAALALTSVTRGSDAAVPALQEALTDPHPGVRYSAAQALGRIATPRALSAFQRYTRVEATKLIQTTQTP